MAFAFTGAASAYPGMGRSLLLALPGLVDGLASRVADIEGIAGAFYREGDPDAATPFRQLAGSSFLCQLHATLSLDVLKLRPAASIGLSSGETNAMFAFGIWRDMDGLLGDVAASGLYSEALANRFDAVRVHWGLPPGTPIAWDNWHVRAPAAAVADAIAGEPPRLPHHRQQPGRLRDRRRRGRLPRGPGGAGRSAGASARPRSRGALRGRVAVRGGVAARPQPRDVRADPAGAFLFECVRRRLRADRRYRD